MFQSQRKFPKRLQARRTKPTAAVEVNMPTESEKVFAIPELLEMVLLNLPWNNLFYLHRVNKTFRDTIERSVKFRRCMHLEYKMPGDEYGIEVPPYPQFVGCSLVERLAVNHDVSFGPFEMTHSPFTPGETIVLQYSLTLSLPAPFQAAGMGMHTGTRKHASVGSWRSIKLTDERQPFCVYIGLRKRLPPPAHWSSGVHPDQHTVYYCETFNFAAGQGTLGDIADAVDKIQKRTPDEHMKRHEKLLRDRMQEAGYEWCKGRVRDGGVSESVMTYRY